MNKHNKYNAIDTATLLKILCYGYNIESIIQFP